MNHLAMTDLPSVSQVHDFWNVEACGSHFLANERGTEEFYRKYRDFRYRSEWHIPSLVPFTETKGKHVLEIGCGNGADGTLFAQAGAIYTGVDLTETAVEATRIHFRTLGLKGTFQIEHAERLSFADQTFDFVYSYGVLHHTAYPDVAFSEIYRVLKPGGRAVIMLYNKHSFNYYVRIMGYMRARVIWRILTNLGRLSKDRKKLADNLKGLRGNEDPSVWQVHYENFLKTGWAYLRSANFIHHATDGPECPFAYVYTRSDAKTTFGKFPVARTQIAHFPLRKYSLGRWVPWRMEKVLGSCMGWYLFFYLGK